MQGASKRESETYVSTLNFEVSGNAAACSRNSFLQEYE